MRLKGLLLFGLALAILLGSASGGAVQQEGVVVLLEITNICEQQTLSISTIVFTRNFIPIAAQTITPPVRINPGETRPFGPYELPTTPNDLTIKGYLDREPFSITIMPFIPNKVYQEGCLQLIAYFEGVPGERPEEEKPYREGQTLEEVRESLELAGVEVRQKGSQAEPGFNFDPDDPMLIGSLGPFSATLMFVASPWTLRAALTWDNPGADLDLIIFGIGGSVCWQLTPPGVLSELCDRPPQAPVSSPLGIFGVFIINFSPFHQAYVLAWSS